MFLIATTAIYLLYVQFSPTMGNIWYRCGYFTPKGAILLMVHPLYEPAMWWPSMWIINYFIWIAVSFLLANIELLKATAVQLKLNSTQS